MAAMSFRSIEEAYVWVKRERWDRIEAVVKAARDVQRGVNIQLLYQALAALDSQEKGA